MSRLHRLFDHVPEAVLEATRLTREGRLLEATALLRGTAPGPAADAKPPARSPSSGSPAGSPPTLDLVPPRAGSGEAWSLDGGSPAGEPLGASAAAPAKGLRLSPDLARLDPHGWAKPGRRVEPPVAPGASFAEHAFANDRGRRSYKLYVPASQTGAPMPLVVALHGCTQSPDDFACGTGWNALAEEHGLLVAYPAQDPAANASRCWNWFNPADQARGQGEPSLIAGLVADVASRHPVDRARVYACGLSAGGAAAAVLGVTYPDVFAAIGVHSGLACGAARDVASAFAAMRQGGPGSADAAHRVPTIVFHGDADRTVHPGNADHVLAQAKGAHGALATTRQGRSAGGRRYTVTVRSDAEGRTVQEHWLLHGGAHAWSGGSPTGTYTDPTGPDASREMLRFFLQHSLKR